MASNPLHPVRLRARATGHTPSPSASIIDSLSARTTEAGGPRGFDLHKNVRGRKRHILIDTEGLPVHALDQPANIQDRDGAPLLLADVPPAFESLSRLWADAAYAGDKFRPARAAAPA